MKLKQIFLCLSIFIMPEAGSANILDGLWGKSCPYKIEKKMIPGLDGSGGLFYGLFRADIYNPSNDFILRELVVRIKGSLLGKIVARDYRDDVFIKPQSTGTFQVEVGNGWKDVSWSIVEVSVCDVQ